MNNIDHDKIIRSVATSTAIETGQNSEEIEQKLRGMSYMTKSVTLADDLCGCYYCFYIFPISEVEFYVDNGRTSLCPNCMIDSVIIPCADQAELEKLHEYYFSDLLYDNN